MREIKGFGAVLNGFWGIFNRMNVRPQGWAVRL